VASMHQQGQLKPRIAQAFAMDRAAEAFAMAQDRQTLGRVLLLP